MAMSVAYRIDLFSRPGFYEERVDPPGPRSCYEEGKRFGEALCKAYHDEYGLNVRIARIFNSYGPRLRAEGFYGRVVSRFFLQSLRGEDVTVYGDGSQTRSFCYVADTVTGLLVLCGGEGLAGDAVNLGSRQETRIIDLARKIISLSSSSSQVSFQPFPPGDHRRRLPDGEKAQKTIHWGPRVGLDEGLKRTLHWFSNKKSH